VVAKVQQVTGTGATLTLNGVTASNFLSLHSSAFQAAGTTAETTPTDTNGTWSIGLSATMADLGSQGIGAAIFYCENVNSGTHTVTPQNLNSKHRTLTEWSGILTASSKDQSTSAKTENTNHQSQATGTTGTTAQDAELSLICHCLGASPGSANIGYTDPVTNYTTIDKTSDDSSSVASFHAYQVLSATGTQTATFNWTDTSASQSGQGCIVTFKAVSGPTIDTQPSDAVAYNGDTANFSVSATASAGSLTYQWQISTDRCVSFSNVSSGSGGTTSSYTTGVLAFSDDQTFYRCAVTDDNGTTNTRAASLRIATRSTVAWYTA